MQRAFLAVVFLCLMLTGRGQTQDDWGQTAPEEDRLSSLTIGFKHYSVEDGLSNRQTYHIFQDSRGFMWISTYSGIDRFDGKDFKNYSGKENGFRKYSSFRIFEDRQGRIWFQHFDEMGNDDREGYWVFDVFDPESEMAAALADIYDPPFAESEIHWADADRNRNIWIALRKGGIFKFDGKRFQKVIDDNPSTFLQDICITPDSKLAMISGKELSVWDTLGQKLQTIKIPGNINGIQAGQDRRIWLNQSNHIWKNDNERVQKDELALWFLKDGEIIPFIEGKINPSVFEQYWYSHHPIAEDRKHRIWGIKDHKLRIYDLQGRVISGDVLNDIASGKPGTQLFDLNNYNPFHIYFDATNNVWLATSNGLVRLFITEPLFQTWLTSEDLRDCRGIVSDNHGNIYMIYQGIYKLEEDSDRAIKVANLGYYDADIDKKGHLWIGDYLARVIHFDPVTNTATEVRHPEFSGEGGFMGARTVMAAEKSNLLWIGTDIKGIFYMDIDERAFLPLTMLNGFDELATARVQYLKENSEGIWACTHSGLYLIDEKLGVRDRFTVKDGVLPSDLINHIHFDAEGHIWLATQGDGMVFWDRQNNTFKQFTTLEGLSDNVIYAVYEDRLGYLWLPSNEGLMRFNKNNQTVKTFTVKDGLPHKEFNTVAHFQDDNGKMYFGGLGGFIAFDPGDFPLEEAGFANGSLSVTGFEKFDASTGLVINGIKDLQETGKIVLTPSNKSFLLKFTLPDYSDNGKVRYGYRIKGWQNEWNFIHENFLRINGLPYGNYELELTAQNAQGQWAAENLSYPITVSKPFYMKTGFLILSFLLFSMIILGFYKRRTYKLKKDRKRLELEVKKRTETIEKQKEELASANAVKDRLFAIIGHDLRGPLFSLQGLDEQINYLLETGQTERLKELGANMEKSAKYLSDTLNNLLNWSMYQMGRFPYQPEKIDLKNTSEMVLALFENNAKIKQVNLEMNIPANTSVYADKNAVSTILRNLVSNGIKFTGNEGKVSIAAIPAKETVEIQVSDTGVGMPSQKVRQFLDGSPLDSSRGTKGEKSTGLGLMLVKDLVIQNKGSIDLKSIPGKGSVFKVKLPLEQN